MRKTSIAVAVVAAGVTLAFSPSASATIHPIVESFDCANAGFDVANPPGQSRSDLPSDHQALSVTDPAGPAWFGHKLDGNCGKVGQP